MGSTTVVYGDINHTLYYKKQVKFTTGRFSDPNRYTLETASKSTVSPLYAATWFWRSFEATEPWLTNELVVDTNSKLSDFSTALETLYEARSTVKTIEKRLVSILRAARRIPKSAYNVIRELAGTRKGKSISHSGIPGAWLEFNFVLKPLYGDVQGFLAIMDRPFKGTRVRGRAERRTSSHVTDVRSCSATVRRSQVGYVTVDNPNVDIVQRMGLTDVIALSWELAPWSWAIDYFANVGSLLQNITPRFSHMTFTKWCNSHFTTASNAYFQYKPGTATKVWVKGKGATLYRDLGRLATITPAFNFELNLQRISYLCSAIALTLKGKLK